MHAALYAFAALGCLAMAFLFAKGPDDTWERVVMALVFAVTAGAFLSLAVP